MLFPDNPTNGQQANINGVVYTYSSSLTAWVVTSNFSGNVTVDQINANAVVSTNTIGATEITATTINATNFVGSGSQITGVVPTIVANGTSNISVASSGNITTTVNGNVATVVSSSGIQSQFVTSPRTISSNTTISGDVNAMTAGPVTIANGIIVTIANGSEWSIV